MGGLLAVSRGLDWFISKIGKLAAWLLIPMMAVIIIDVITRKFNLLAAAEDYFRSSGMIGIADFITIHLTSTKLQEMEWHLHAALFLLCLGFAYLRNSHVRIEVVRERFDTRTKAWLELIGGVIFLVPYAGLVLWYGVGYAERSFDNNEVSAALTGLSHRWIIKSFVPLGMVLLLIAGLAVILRNIAFLAGDKKDQDDAQAIADELHDPLEELRKIQAALDARKAADAADAAAGSVPATSRAASRTAGQPDNKSDSRGDA